MTEITMNYWSLAAVCGVWFMLGACFGSWVQERWGDDDANEGAEDER